MEEPRAHPAAERVSEAGSIRRRAETVRDLDLIATASDPARSPTTSRALPGSRRSWRRGPRRRPWSPTTAAVRPAGRPARVLREPAPALHGLEGPQRRAPRGRRAARALRLRVRRRRTPRPARSSPPRPRALYERLGYAWIPPELRENRGELEAAREASCRSCSSSTTCRATSTCTPTGRTAATRSRRWSRPARPRAGATSRSATTRSGSRTAAGAPGRGDRRALEAARRDPDPERASRSTSGATARST